MIGADLRDRGEWSEVIGLIPERYGPVRNGRRSNDMDWDAKADRLFDDEFEAGGSYFDGPNDFVADALRAAYEQGLEDAAKFFDERAAVQRAAMADYDGPHRSAWWRLAEAALADDENRAKAIRELKEK